MRDDVTPVRRNSRAHVALVVAALIALCAIPYAQTISHAFIAYDDNSYITENDIVQRGLTWEGIRWAFTTFHAANWHPLTWLSHMLDVKFFGSERAGPHVIVNAVIHAMNAVLLFGVLLRMTASLWRSALVAALFAVHPLHVESVAWVSERKDVLSTFFGLLAIWAYIAYVSMLTPKLEEGRGGRAPANGPPRRWMAYLAMLISFALSLMAKPMLVTLPCVLLLLDWWPLRRWNRLGGDRSAAQLIVEKIPLFLLTIASCVMTVVAQKSGGAVFPLEAMPLEQRVQNSVIAYAAYIGKVFWPVDLAVLYPHPGSWEAWRVALSAVVLVAITAIVSAQRRKRPALLVGWLFYLGTLVPVIGLVQVGVQSIADRYTYVPLIGLFIMLAWSLPSASAKYSAPIAIVIIAALTARTSAQVAHWQNSFTLFKRTLAITTRNYIIETNLGYAYKKSGKLDEAILHYRAALEVNPHYALAHENIGSALVASNHPNEAVSHLERAVALRPDLARTRTNFGVALYQAGRFSEAEATFKKAIELDPQYAQAHFNLGVLYSNQTKRQEAIDQYRAALAVDPSLAEAHLRIGIELAIQKQYDHAVAEFQNALRVRPNYVEAKRYLDAAILKRDQTR